MAGSIGAKPPCSIQSDRRFAPFFHLKSSFCFGYLWDIHLFERQTVSMKQNIGPSLLYIKMLAAGVLGFEPVIKVFKL